MNLFDIASEYREQVAVLESLDIDEQTLADTLESISGDLTVKSNNIAALCRNMEANASAIKDAEAQMAARRKALENRAKAMRRWLLTGMQVAGVSKIESPYFAITIKKNPPAVEVYEPGLVPAEYMKDPPPPPPEIDKKLIAQAIKDGHDVPGCRLTQGERVDIK